jgi:hypothetical protein
MIERQEVGGRPAVVAYLTAKFEPTDKDAAQIVKVVFDDGEIRFLVPSSGRPGAGGEEEDEE